MKLVFFEYRFIWTLIRKRHLWSVRNKIWLIHPLSHLNPDSQFLKLSKIIGNNLKDYQLQLWRFQEIRLKTGLLIVTIMTHLFLTIYWNVNRIRKCSLIYPDSGNVVSSYEIIEFYISIRFWSGIPVYILKTESYIFIE